MLKKCFIDKLRKDEDIKKLRKEYFELFGKQRPYFLIDYDRPSIDLIKKHIESEIKQEKLLREIEPYLLDFDRMNISDIKIKSNAPKEIQNKFNDFMFITRELEADKSYDQYNFKD